MTARQLSLLDEPDDWHLETHHRIVGIEGVAEARRLLDALRSRTGGARTMLRPDAR